MNSTTTNFNIVTTVNGSVRLKTEYLKLKISAHYLCDEEDFNRYCINKNIATTDYEGFKNVLTFCNVMEGYMLNQLFLNKYGARYVGYSYCLDWNFSNQTASYKYYFNVKSKKKFNYARIKMGF